MKTVAFFVRQFSERGTEVSIYDYALQNELVLGNRSLVVCLTPDAQRRAGLPELRHSYHKFAVRFPVVEIETIQNLQVVIEDHGVDLFYTQTPGGKDVCDFANRRIYGECKTAKHCVFDYSCPESDYHSGISNFLNTKHGTNIPVVPYIVDLPEVSGSLRDLLGIPRSAFVFGRYGGVSQFNISFVHDCVRNILAERRDIFFLFMNTATFYEHDRILYLQREIDLDRKARFINSCDAMIHARAMGETFGAAIAEFSSKNRPVVTCNCGDAEHIELLGEKAIIYETPEDLMQIFRSIEEIVSRRHDWNAYQRFSPRMIMASFAATYLCE